MNSAMPLFVLIHSPLVGSLTWTLVADQLRQRGWKGIVPALVDVPHSEEPYWKQQAKSVSQALGELPRTAPLILVAHSGAGPLLPVIRQSVPNPVHAFVFVDAGIPHENATRLEMMRTEGSTWAQDFQAYLEAGGRFPNWSSEDLREILPEDRLREQLLAELRPRGLDFFIEPIPVFDGWPDAPCAYILFSPPYQRAEIEARQMGWFTYTLKAGHFHMLVDPGTVTDLILKAIYEISLTLHE
jgi:hypothetical protein